MLESKLEMSGSKEEILDSKIKMSGLGSKEEMSDLGSKEDMFESKIKMPKISDLLDGNDELTFTLSDMDVCFANAIRRTILSDIDVCCILSENHETNNVEIEMNSSRLHNEILKHRLSCIPVHVESDIEKFCETYILEMDCENKSDSIMYVTSEDFHIKNIVSGEYIESKKIFPPDSISRDYIDFARLRPKISDSIPGEKLKLSARFSISNAGFNSMYNVVSKCSYNNSFDSNLALSKWKDIESSLGDISNDLRSFHKKNFYLLDAKRCFFHNSFDFFIQGLHVFDNRQIFLKSLHKLIHKLQNLTFHIISSESTMTNSFDIILHNEDYTIGKILEFIFYTHLFQNDNNILNFCAFKKFHPHDTQSTIRIAFTQHSTLLQTEDILHHSIRIALNIFKHLIHIF
jgi:DNA-directed RNA polymerase subunit L